jgi:DNA invertase Pin-like site-specific DNA recombinase
MSLSLPDSARRQEQIPGDETCASGDVHIIESDLIKMRTREGMKVARAKGRLRGKRPKLSPRQEAHLVQLHHAGAHTSAELAKLFPVARSTVYRAIGRTHTAAPSES